MSKYGYFDDKDRFIEGIKKFAKSTPFNITEINSAAEQLKDPRLVIQQKKSLLTRLIKWIGVKVFLINVKCSTVIRKCLRWIFRWVFPETSATYELPKMNYVEYDLQFIKSGYEMSYVQCQQLRFNNSLYGRIEHIKKDLAIGIALELLEKGVFVVEQEDETNKGYMSISLVLPVGVKR